MTMSRMRTAWLAVASLLAAAPAHAQHDSYPPDLGVAGPVVWNLGGLVTFPLGPSSDRVQTGGGFVGGLTYNFSHPLGLQLEYGVSWFDLKNNSARLSNLGVFGHGNLQYFNANFVLRPGHAGRSGFYLVAGGGAYYRRATVNRVEGTAVAPYCDPYLFYCSAVPVTASSVVGERSRWDGGVDGGIGFTFALGAPVRVYLEARYHYIFGPKVTDVNGGRRSTDGQFLPVTIGIQF